MTEDRPSFVDISAQLTVPSVLLPPDAPQAEAALRDALAHSEAAPIERYRALQDVVRRGPSIVGGWANLAAVARQLGRDIEAYAYARTGYHRGLDRLRANGWRGVGHVPWAHRPNQPVLLAFHELFRAAELIGETPEADRMKQLLLDSDPSDPYGVDAGSGDE